MMESSSSQAALNDDDVDPLLKEKFELFVMSEAGKPIYSFNKRDDTVTLMPLCSALMNYAQKTQKEALVAMRTSDKISISFATKPPLIIIVINETNSSIDTKILVEQVEAQIISILTYKNLQTVFMERPSFDLKRLLYGSEKLIDAIVRLTVTVPLFEGPSNQSSFSNSIHSTITSVINRNSKNILFSLLFQIVDASGKAIVDDNDGDNNSSKRRDDSVNFRLVTNCNHHNRHRLKLKDVQIILALILGSRTQLFSAESLWMPVCLPRFNRDAFLHSYIAFINDAKYCLAMFSIDREEFSMCQTSKSSIEEKLDALIKEGKGSM